MSDTYYLYLLRCHDNTLYCGITNNIPKRLSIHNAGKGAKYTRSRLPVQVVYTELASSKSAALQREAMVKKMTKVQKEDLIVQHNT